MAKVAFNRKASATWKGSGKEGKGTLSTQTGTLKDKAYSYNSRFVDGNASTNPEELIGAAHAGCFTMQLSFLLNEEGYTADTLSTDATVYFEDGTIPKIVLQLTGIVPGIERDEFARIANKAKEVCPVSKLLNADIELVVNHEEQ